MPREDSNDRDLEGAGFWRDLAISEAQFEDGDGISSDEIKAKYGVDDR